MHKKLKQPDPEQSRTGEASTAPPPELEVVSFEDELRKAIKARIGKAPFFGKEDETIFIELCSELRSLPDDSERAAEILDRIHGGNLFLLCDGNWQQFQQRINPLAADRAEGVTAKQGHPERQLATAPPRPLVTPTNSDAPVQTVAAQPGDAKPKGPLAASPAPNVEQGPGMSVARAQNVVGQASAGKEAAAHAIGPKPKPSTEVGRAAQSVTKHSSAASTATDTGHKNAPSSQAQTSKSDRVLPSDGNGGKNSVNQGANSPSQMPGPLKVSSDLPPERGRLVVDFELAKLDMNAGTESRELNSQVVDEYAEHWKSGGTFEPIIVYQDRDHHFPADGFHRVAGARKAGRTHVPALVRVGNRLEALEASLRSNHAHGLRRSPKDKCYAVDKALKKFSDRSDRMIAEMCGVSPNFVGKRRKLEPEPSTAHEDSSAKPAQKTRVGRDGKRRKMPSPKADAQAKSAQKPQANDQSGAQDLKQALCQVKELAKALIAEVRQFDKLHPDERKRLKPALEPLLASLAKLLI